MAEGPITDAELDQIRELHGAGQSRNDIARALGRSGQTISKHAERLGLTFERGEQVAAATAAKVADAKTRRAQLQLDLLADAERLRQQLFQPAHAFNFGGKDNDYNERTIDEPTFADKRNIMQAVSTAITASIKIDEHDRTTESGAAIDLWIATMVGPGE